jgi:CBS domain-containing protein
MNLRSVVAGRETYFVPAADNIRQVAEYMSQRRIGAVAVLDGQRVAGIVSERDIMSKVVAKGLDPAHTKVSEVMSRELLVASPDDSYEDAARKMRQAGIRHLPVVEDGRLIGMISQRDLLQVDLTAKDEEIRWLNAYIHFIPPGHPGGGA